MQKKSRGRSISALCAKMLRGGFRDSPLHGELSAVRLTEGLSAIGNPSVNASRCHLPLHKGGFSPCNNTKRTVLKKKEARWASFFGKQ